MSKYNPKHLVTKERTDNYFYGTYKGSEIEINRETPDESFYIQVWDDGGFGYDGWASEEVTTIEEAVKEAIDGAQL